MSSYLPFWVFRKFHKFWVLCRLTGTTIWPAKWVDYLYKRSKNHLTCLLNQPNCQVSSLHITSPWILQIERLLLFYSFNYIYLYSRSATVSNLILQEKFWSARIYSHRNISLLQKVSFRSSRFCIVLLQICLFVASLRQNFTKIMNLKEAHSLHLRVTSKTERSFPLNFPIFFWAENFWTAASKMIQQSFTLLCLLHWNDAV